MHHVYTPKWPHFRPPWVLEFKASKSLAFSGCVPFPVQARLCSQLLSEALINILSSFSLTFNIIVSAFTLHLETPWLTKDTWCLEAMYYVYAAICKHHIIVASPLTGSWEHRSPSASLFLCPTYHSLSTSLPLGCGVTDEGPESHIDLAQCKVLLFLQVLLTPAGQSLG